MKKLIYVDKRPDGQFQIYNRFDLVPYYNLKSGGSFAVCYARLMGISYPNYLRLCRDEFGATLYGQDCLYISTVWSDPAQAEPLAKMLNERLNKILAKKDAMKI